MPGKSSRGSDRGGVVIWGLALIAVGCWFLLRTLGFPLPGLGQMWPIFPMLVGIAIFIGWLFTPDKQANHGMMIPATINVLIGLFFFSFTLGLLSWDNMGVLWPVFPLIVGIAFFVAWVFSLFTAWALLIPAGITSTVGIVGLGVTLSAQSGLLRLVLRFWPVALIGLGVLVLFGGLLSGPSSWYRREDTSSPLSVPQRDVQVYEPAEDETSP